MCQLNLLEDLKMDLPCLQNKDVKNAILLSLDEMEEVSEALAKKFKEIAEELINNYCIVKKKDNTTEVVYRFMELEFYYFSSDHPDIITYPRKAEAGDWFFHASGVDICFESNVDTQAETGKPVSGPSTYKFGGILIRALSKHVKNKDGKEDIFYITGPLNCCYELFDKFSAFSPAKDFPIIKKCEIKNEVDVQSCGRYFHFSTSLGTKLTNIYKEVWSKGEEEKGIDKETFKSYLENKYCFYDEEAFEQYNKLGKSYQANPTKPKKDKEGKVNENWRLSYKE